MSQEAIVDAVADGMIRVLGVKNNQKF